MSKSFFRGQSKLEDIERRYPESIISDEEARKRKEESQGKHRAEIVTESTMRERIKLIHGDALKEIKHIKDNSIDLILTDPPYEQVDYLKTSRLTNMEKKSCVDEFSRMLKRTGSIVLFCGQDDKFIWHTLLSKKFIFKRELEMIYQPGFSPQRNFIPTHESALFFVKTEDYYWNEHCSTPTTVYKCKRSPVGGRSSDKDDYYGIPRDRLGTTPKPLGLITSLIDKLCPENGTVFEPFLGSGTTALGCVLKGRKCIGIEIDKDIFTFAKKRIESSRSINDFGNEEEANG